MAGGFFGGLAEGLDSSRARQIQQQQIDQQGQYQQGLLNISQQRLQNEQRRQNLEYADKSISDAMSHVDKTIESLRAAGKSTAEIAKVIAHITQPVKTLAAKAGRDPAMIDAQIATSLAQPSAGEIISGALGGGGDKVSSNYGPQIASASQKYDIPADILHNTINQESGGNPNAVNSKSGAAGVAQFTPATAKDRGVNPMDPNSAIPGAASYLSDLKNQFGGNMGLALAAYNWGPGNVQKWMQSGADPSKMPAETRNYVEKITGKPLEASTQPHAQNSNIDQIGKLATALSSSAIPAPVKTALQAKLKQMVNPNYDIKLIKDPVTGQQNAVRIDKSTGDMLNPDGTPYHQTGWPQIDQSVHGDQFISELTKTDQSLANAVKAVGDYTLDPSKITGFGDPSTKVHILGMIKQYNPDYDEKLYDRYHAGNQAWARGGPSSPATQTKSYSVLVGHLNLLKQLTVALNNKDTQTINRLKNSWAAEFGSALPNSIQAVGDIVTDELTKAVLGGAGALGDREKVAKRVSANSNTAGQMIDLMDNYTKLSSGQLEGLKKQFEAQTGRKDFNTFLTPEAQALFENKKGDQKTQGSSVVDWQTYFGNSK